MFTRRVSKFAFALMVPLLLFGCVLTPGKFVSGLTVNKDRSFTFTYKGEVIAIDPASEMTKGMKGIGDAKPDKPNLKSEDAPPKDDEDTERKRRAMAEALAKEAGYRSVQYLGKGKFMIDYEINGILSHNFVYPYNQDAEILFPFITVELRQGNTMRVRAPGYADSSDASSKMGMGSAGNDNSKFLDGLFTLNTDAEIVSQNNEDGAKTANGRSVTTWRATPLTKDAPTAVLRFAK
jgi:hypothetical protein